MVVETDPAQVYADDSRDRPPASFAQMVMEGETLPSFMQMGVGADPSQLAATKSHT